MGAGRKVMIAGAVALFAGGGIAVAASAMADSPMGSSVESSGSPSGSAGIDRGVITITETQNPVTSVWQYQCSEADTAGPDAARIKVVTAVDSGCLIKGLSATHPFQLTPDGLDSLAVGMTMGFPTVYAAATYTGLSRDETGDLLVTLVNASGAQYLELTPTGTYDWMVILP